MLQIADERYQRVQVELKHTVEMLHEEQERVIKIETIKKSLEIEVKNLSIRLEEVEANAIVGGKRIISKLEARVSSVVWEMGAGCSETMSRNLSFSSRFSKSARYLRMFCFGP